MRKTQLDNITSDAKLIFLVKRIGTERPMCVRFETDKPYLKLREISIGNAVMRS